MKLFGSLPLKRFAISVMCVAALGASVAAAAFSFSWFTNRNSISNTKISGKTAGAYYASGKGTEDDPYILNKPRHVYNLAWLQYMGTYNDDLSTGTTSTANPTYFKLDADIDMSGWVTPPSAQMTSLS